MPLTLCRLRQSTCSKLEFAEPRVAALLRRLHCQRRGSHFVLSVKGWDCHRLISFSLIELVLAHRTEVSVSPSIVSVSIQGFDRVVSIFSSRHNHNSSQQFLEILVKLSPLHVASEYLHRFSLPSQISHSNYRVSSRDSQFNLFWGWSSAFNLLALLWDQQSPISRAVWEPWPW